MTMPAVEERVDRLEEAIDRFVANVGVEFNKLYNSQMRTEAELRELKEENRRDKREMNRKWGDLANKLGTMVEDLVYPSLPRVIKETLGQEPQRIWARFKQRLPDGLLKEFDAIARTQDLVCLNSTKATLRSGDVDAFVTDIATFREYFPEYRDLPLVGILATLAVEESVLNYAEKQGFLVLAIGDEVMEVKNRPGFEPKRW
jgi:ABC-type amino acid transport substrate-binding protein